MRTVLKHIIGRTYKPMLEKWLSKTRSYRQADITLQIPPQVFHPGFFSSTQLLWNYIDTFSLENKKLLELGAGSGLISMKAYKKGAVVTATDINKTAIEFLALNSEANDCELQITQSDLFDNIPLQTFDIIAINPPYYKKDPATAIEFAWYCGQQGEYFEKLFSQLGNYMHAQTEVLMVCCDGCDLPMIEKMSATRNFLFSCLLSKPGLLETNFIFKIEKNK